MSGERIIIEAEIRTRIRGLDLGDRGGGVGSRVGSREIAAGGCSAKWVPPRQSRASAYNQLGPTTIMMPRARLQDEVGQESEWHSRVIRRYQRRTERVDRAILGLYLSGINTWRCAERWRRGCAGRRYQGWVSRLVGRMQISGEESEASWS